MLAAPPSPKGLPDRQSAGQRLPSWPCDSWAEGWMDASWSGASVGTKKSMAMLLSLSCHSRIEALAGHLPPAIPFSPPPPCPAIPRGCFWRHLWGTGWAYSIPEFQSRRDLLKTEQVEKSMDLYTHIPSNPRETAGQ